MNRHSCRSVLALLIAVIAVAAVRVTPAAAEPAAQPGPGTPVLTASGVPGQRIAVDTPPERYATPAAAVVSPTIYLNRCRGGCTVHMGNNDARTDTSSIPTPGPGAPGPSFLVSEFRDSNMNVGDAANPEWALLVQCMKDVYSPYNVTITDVRPATGLNFHEAIIAGDPQDVGLSDKILGVAPLSTVCAAIDNVMSFSFANHHMRDTQNANVLILNVCWTAAQESAHAYGLDHEYTFTSANTANNHSACNDPMTYRNDCGGEKFFRNQDANCGETNDRDCKCGGRQNSHQKMLSVFGAGTPNTGVPSIALTSPASGTTLGATVALTAGAKRGVSHVDLYLNGYKWAEKPGAFIGANGQANPSSYAVTVPADVPNSIIDVKAIAFDDLGTATESAVVTVTKGAPCASAATCAKGQKCEAGKCFWDPPAGEIGDSCSYAQFCKSGLCTGTADTQICTQSCIPGVTDSCPANSGLECLMQSPNTGVCFFSTTGGCCSVSGGGGLWWVHASLALAVLGWITRRRRR